MSDRTNDLEEIYESMLRSDAALFPILPYGNIEKIKVADDEPMPELPILPLRNVVLFPGQIIPVAVGRERSLRLVRWLEKTGGYFGAITQRSLDVDDPTDKDLYSVGVVAQLDGISESLDGRVGITIKGIQRFRLKKIVSSEPFLAASIELLSSTGGSATQESKVLVNTLKENFIESFRFIGKPLPHPYVERLQQIKNVESIVNFVVSATSISVKKIQELLEINNIKERGLKVLSYQQVELQMLKLKANLNEKTRQEIDKHNKEYFLQQQMRAIQDELGGGDNELSEIRAEAQSKKWSSETAVAFEREVKKAEKLNPQSPDYSVQMQYLRTVLSLPWGIYTQDNFDIKKAEKKLNSEHYGLEKVKERILEHLAVLKLRGDMKSPILCLYGPPGVGKTSLGKSIAESLGRKYVRVSLGGVHDESEIRGHRRTYVGAMCGRIMQSLIKAGSSNPVFVLDEIDKLGGDSFKGDPASALLEVLDPEQNMAFHDNFLDLDYDLSKVLFIATANNIGELSQPLRDRMELIEVSGYIAEEKHQIAKKYLIPKEIKEHGLEDRGIKFAPKAIDTIIEEYTRESGVRTLNKRIAQILRKLAVQVSTKQELANEVSPSLVREYLGKPTFQRDKYQSNEHAGVVVGLAWTSVGGDILYIESSLHKGQEGKLTLTGSLGDVMKESAVLALSYIMSHQQELGIDESVLKDKSVHVHVPEGAVPKDGPSAGITIVTSLVSTMLRRKVKAHLAMTGEITLRGKVLPVGGIKEKILAAKRSGIKEIIMCKENERDVLEIKDIYLSGLTFHYVEDISEVLRLALTDEFVD